MANYFRGIPSVLKSITGRVSDVIRDMSNSSTDKIFETQNSITIDNTLITIDSSLITIDHT